jgi:hypothetical protein
MIMVIKGKKEITRMGFYMDYILNVMVMEY